MTNNLILQMLLVLKKSSDVNLIYFIINYFIIVDLTYLLDNCYISYLLTTMLNQQHAAQFIANTRQRDRVAMTWPLMVHNINSNTKFLLDLGCGDAAYHPYIFEKIQSIEKIVGTDISKDVLPKVSPHPKSQFRVLDSTKPSEELVGKFNTILQSYMVPHLSPQQLVSFLENASHWLRENGQLVLISYNNNKAYLSKAYGHGNLLYWVAKQGTEMPLKDGQPFQVQIGQWINTDYYYSPGYLCSELQKKGFSAKVNYLTMEIVDQRYYSQEQARLLVDSQSIYAIVAKKMK